MRPHIFLNEHKRLRSGWWIAAFLGVLAALLLPLILSVHEQQAGVPVVYQLGVVIVASLILQALRRKPLSDLVGNVNTLPHDLLGGLASGALLMAAPAALLVAIGAVTWQTNANAAAVIGPTLAALAVAAATEELVFRGFLFQRLLDGLGVWPAQLIIAAMFLLTHSDALRGQGALGTLAGANIFLASIMFGLAYLRTRGLAMPIALHFAANALQGPVLGFGVSGSEQSGLLQALPEPGMELLTGGTFGLEASIPGFLAVIALTAILWQRGPQGLQH